MAQRINAHGSQNLSVSTCRVEEPYYSGVRDQLEKFEYQGEDERKLHCDALLERTLRWSAGSSASGSGLVTV